MNYKIIKISKSSEYPDVENFNYFVVQRKSNLRTRNQTGFGLIEIVLGVAILGLVLVAGISVAQRSLSLNRQALWYSQANFLLVEGMEATRVFRDKGWGNISGMTAGTGYFLTWNNNTGWGTTTATTTVDGKFYRKITASDVHRDANDDIVTSGTLDSGTRKIRVELAWNPGSGTSTKTMDAYFTDI